jgi:hypothetical protein
LGGSVRNVGWGDGLTKRTRSVLVGVVAFLLVGNLVALASHGGDHTPMAMEPSSTGLASDATETTAAPTDTTPTTTSGAPAATGRTAPTQATTPTSEEPLDDEVTEPPIPRPVEWPWGYEYQVDLAPICARIGEEITITFHLKPNGGAVLIATYADGDTHGTQHAGIAREDGKVTYTWKAPPAPGPATVWTQASDHEEKRRGQKNIDFRVLDATEVATTC